MNPEDIVVVFIKRFGDDEIYWAPEWEFDELRKDASVEFIFDEDDMIIWDAKDAAANHGNYVCG